MEVRFGPAAQRELDIVSDFYESQRSGLGDEFLDEVHRYVVLLKEHPMLGRRLLSNRRSLLLSRFPYRLVYAREEQLIRIIAIAHVSQRPFYWRHRVEEPRPAYAGLSIAA
jgi:plasmid stabilization system protein ParE